MNDLGLNLGQVREWFTCEQDTPYVLIRVSTGRAQRLSEDLAIAVRRCYITDSVLLERAAAHCIPQEEIIAAKLPDPGSTMSGDFGEILIYLYQGTREYPANPLGAIKWRLKQDRTKSAPYSDVVHFVLPSWPRSSADDILLCAEIKTKSTDGNFRPIARAIADSLKDRTSRLAKTLVWLRERALTEDLDDVQIDHLDRFINATDHPVAQKRFQAVAVVSGDLETEELANAPREASFEYTVTVVSVPQLQAVYTSVFEAASAATIVVEPVAVVQDVT